MAYKLKDYTNASRYLILDGNLKVVGQLSIDGSIPLLSDSITHSIASEDTSSSWGESLTSDTSGSGASETNSKYDPNAGSKTYTHEGTITVLEKAGTNYKLLDTKHSIAYYEKSLRRWYLLHISTVERNLLNASGHIYSRTLTLIDEALWRLHYNIPTAKTFNNCSLDQALDWCTQNIGGGWEVVNNSNSSLRQTISFSGSDMGSATIQSLLQCYDVEMDCYVLLNRTETEIARKVIDIEDKVNDQRFLKEAIVGSNVLSLTQTKIGNAITKLFVYSSASADGVSTKNGTNLTNSNSDSSSGLTSIAGVNNGLPYLIDDSANRKYNPYYAKGDYLEGVIISDSFVGQSLLSWGKKQLKLLNHDRYAYNMTTTVDYNPPIGATIRAKDNTANPMIDITARVMRKTFSLTNPYGNTCTFGEFTTVKVVTPSWFNSVKGRLANAIERAKSDASSVVPVILTPDGTDFKGSDQSKRFYIQAWSMGTNISGYVQKQGFEFLKYKSDTINIDGILDDSQLGQYEKTLNGYKQILTINDLGSYRAQIDNDYLTSTAEIYPDQPQAAEVANLTYLPFGHKEALQASYKLNDGTFVTTYALAGLPDSLNSHKDDCAILHQDSKGNILGSARIASGGHGSCFGVQEVNSDYCYVYMNTYNDDDKAHKYRLTRIKFMLKQTNVKVTDNKTSRDDFKIGYSTSDYFYFGLDNDTGYGVVVSSKDWKAYSVKLDDLMAGNFKATQVVSLLDYGWNPHQQTWQSVAIKYPYVFWHSGDYDMHDRRVLYGVNLEHKGSIFEVEYNFIDYIKVPAGSQVVEPESLSYKNGKLLVSFNCKIDGADKHQEHVFEIPLVERKD